MLLMSSAVDRVPEVRSAAEPAPDPAAAPGETAVLVVPNSSIQFFDFNVSEVDAIRVRRRFFEESAGEADEGAALHAVALDDDSVQHPVTGAPIDASETYAIDGVQAMEPFLETWIPVPLLREAGEDEDGNTLFDEGPSNWARVHVSRGTSGDGRRPGYRIVLALDTSIDAKPLQGRNYAAPRTEDAIRGAAFRFSSHENDIAGFVSEVWVDDWLSALYREDLSRRRAAAGEEDWGAERGLEHLAHYLTLLAVLGTSGGMPRIRFVPLTPDASAWNAAGVDLVLDIGASRTTALLAEAPAGKPPLERTRVTPLPLRDLSQPWLVHGDTCSSRFEFSRAPFGNEAWSRWSGRTNAFFWPSLARVGREAERLATEQPMGDDWSGLSSPMHYLWDMQAASSAWRFARPAGATGRGALISGLQLTHVTETGDLLDPADKRAAATKPRFARSALTTFFTAELVAQALSAINAPRRNPDGRPRLIEHIVVTHPATLAPHERGILKKRLEGAVELVWRSLGWTEPGAILVPRPPEVRFVSDNATNAGLTYLNNELGHKFSGKAREYLDLMGKQRPEHRGRSLRLASLDIGGGSTCLSVATYEMAETGGLVQVPQLSDGCRTGGDDILKAIVERHLMPALERRLIECKLANAKRFLERIAGGRAGKRCSASGEFGRRFAAEIACPLALSILETHLGSRLNSDDIPIERTLGVLISARGPDAKAVLDELDQLAGEEGADSFSPHETLISFRDRDIAFTIRSVLDGILANVARVVQALDCDVLLVSGWPSRLPAIMDLLLERMPSQPNRIVPLADYRVADWYTVRERNGTLGDPKAAAAMGAVLASAGIVAGLALTQRPLEAEATRLHVGRMSERGLVTSDSVLFVLGETAPGRDGGREQRVCTLSVEPPMVLGGRRINLENWPATPLFWLDCETAEHKMRNRGPFKVTIERVPSERGEPETLRVVRACDADGNNLSPAEVALRLQTSRSPKGHWLDTGAIAVE